MVTPDKNRFNVLIPERETRTRLVRSEHVSNFMFCLFICGRCILGTVSGGSDNLATETCQLLAVCDACSFCECCRSKDCDVIRVAAHRPRGKQEEGQPPEYNFVTEENGLYREQRDGYAQRSSRHATEHGPGRHCWATTLAS